MGFLAGFPNAFSPQFVLVRNLRSVCSLSGAVHSRCWVVGLPWMRRLHNLGWWMLLAPKLFQCSMMKVACCSEGNSCLVCVFGESIFKTTVSGLVGGVYSWRQLGRGEILFAWGHEAHGLFFTRLQYTERFCGFPLQGLPQGWF